MNLFCFASRSERNIWIGVEARMWAVATVSDAQMKGRATKARKYLRIGDKGVLYCNPTHSFTTPFIIRSEVDTSKVVTDVWPEPWRLPFDIEPLGNPSRQLHKDKAYERWPILQSTNQNRVSAAMNITGTTVFVPNEISHDEWDIILSDLKTGA